MNKRNLIIALAFPIAVLLALIFYRQVMVMKGTEIILPISGFDPRDILSGHYLIYRIDYGIGDNDFCYDRENSGSDEYICLRKDVKNNAYTSIILPDPDFFDPEDSECICLIKGKCENGRFTAGIEKFFIPEEYASLLDRAVRNRQGKIVLSVSRNGSAVIKDLLIDGKSWKEYKDK